MKLFFFTNKKKSRQNKKKFSRKNTSPVKIWGLSDTYLRLYSCLKTVRREFSNFPNKTLSTVSQPGHLQWMSRAQKMGDEISVKIPIDEFSTFVVKNPWKMPKSVPHVLPRSATYDQKSSILKKVFKNLWAGASFEVWYVVIPSKTKKLCKLKELKEWAVTHPSTDLARCCLTFKIGWSPLKVATYAPQPTTPGSHVLYVDRSPCKCSLPKSWPHL